MTADQTQATGQSNQGEKSSPLSEHDRPVPSVSLWEQEAALRNS